MERAVSAPPMPLNENGDMEASQSSPHAEVELKTRYIANPTLYESKTRAL